MQQAARFFLVPTNYTLTLADTPPGLGSRWDEIAQKLASWRLEGNRTWIERSANKMTFSPTLNLADFHHNDWRPLQHVIVHGLASHAARTRALADAAFCIVAAPQRTANMAGRNQQSRSTPLYSGGPTAPAHSTCPTDWHAGCLGKPIAVVDVADADFPAWRLCPHPLWTADRTVCADKSVLRVVGSPPLMADRAPLLPHCNLVSVPWLSHTRSAVTARRSLPAAQRTVWISGAFSAGNHGFAGIRGWAEWRRELRDACNGMGSLAKCIWIYQPLSGNTARAAVELYAQSVFWCRRLLRTIYSYILYYTTPNSRPTHSNPFQHILN